VVNTGGPLLLNMALARWRFFMPGWFKRKPQPSSQDARAARFQQHFFAAEGSQVERGCAAAMVAIEEEPVQRQRNKLSAEDQVIFMMAYESFVMWAFKRGLETLMKPPEVTPVILAIHKNFAKRGFYRPDAFEKIWEKMQVVMPKAMNPTPEGVVYPVVEMLMAPTLAGYPLNPMIAADLEFGAFVGLVVGDLFRIARAQVTPSAPR
jgi:hypothetical protein